MGDKRVKQNVNDKMFTPLLSRTEHLFPVSKTLDDMSLTSKAGYLA